MKRYYFDIKIATGSKVAHGAVRAGLRRHLTLVGNICCCQAARYHVGRPATSATARPRRPYFGPRARALSLSFLLSPARSTATTLAAECAAPWLIGQLFGMDPAPCSPVKAMRCPRG